MYRKLCFKFYEICKTIEQKANGSEVFESIGLRIFAVK